ncbi:MAG: response regulator [Nodosilinea sp.]
MVVQNILTPAAGAAYPQQPLVLVVDDDDDSLTLMAYILEQMSCETCFVADGIAALNAAMQQPPHLILSDIHLPYIDGFSLIQQLRANEMTKHIPVVAVTALASRDDRHKILAAGFNDYVSKPFLIEQLERLVQSFITLPVTAA